MSFDSEATSLLTAVTTVDHARRDRWNRLRDSMPTEPFGSRHPARWQLTGYHCSGSLCTSVIWRGVDLETGAPIIGKHYAVDTMGDPLYALFLNELRVHHEMYACVDLVPVLDTHHRLPLIVKPFVPGVGGGSADMPPAPTPEEHERRRALALACAHRVIAHGRSIGLTCTHAIDYGNVLVDGDRAVCVDTCCSEHRAWNVVDDLHVRIAERMWDGPITPEIATELVAFLPEYMRPRFQ